RFTLHQLYDDFGNLLQGQTKIDIHQVERAAWHIWRHRFTGVLHNRDATAGFDRKEAGCAIIAAAAENDTNYLRAMCARRAPKQTVRRWTMTILPWPPREDRHVIFDQQMMMRRRNINAALFVAFFIFSRDCRQAATSA